MEDPVDTLIQDYSSQLFQFYQKNSSTFNMGTATVLTGVYGVWAMFCMPGLKVPFRLKVPYLPSTKEQTSNVMRLLKGRKGLLADLGSGDGRLVFEASSVGFQCTGFEINPLLLAFSRTRAWWRGLPHTQATFVKQDLWKMDVLEEKLQRELPVNARVVVCRFPFSHWPHTCSEGAGLDQAWAYDMCTVCKQSPRLS
ncbi:ATP synthase subunit C lysine N-methyltransferase-like [Aplochiton taeniatus]